MGLRPGAPLPPEDWAGYGRRCGDIEALYRAQAPRLLRFFRRRFAAEEARDLVHETFRRMLRSAESRADQIERPEAYLSRIAGNLAHDHATSPTSCAAQICLEFEEAQIAGPDPHLLLEARDEIARIDAALIRLRPKTREIFVLHRIDGLSYAEIAIVKGMSVGGVEKQIAKALTQLRRALRAR